MLRESWGPAVPDRRSLRKAIVWAEGGEAGSTRRFLPPPARGAAPHQSSILHPDSALGSGVQKRLEKYGVGEGTPKKRASKLYLRLQRKNSGHWKKTELRTLN